jgi:hypothetical protein
MNDEKQAGRQGCQSILFYRKTKDTIQGGEEHRRSMELGALIRAYS